MLGVAEPEVMADLGHGVMDDARVEAAAYVLCKSDKLHFGYFPLVLTANIRHKAAKIAKVRKEYNSIQQVMTLSWGCCGQQAVRCCGIKLIHFKKWPKSRYSGNRFFLGAALAAISDAGASPVCGDITGEKTDDQF